MYSKYKETILANPDLLLEEDHIEKYFCNDLLHNIPDKDGNYEPRWRCNMCFGDLSSTVDEDN